MSELIYGPHSIAAVVEMDPVGILEIWIQSHRQGANIESIANWAQDAGVSVHWVARSVLDRLVSGARHQGIVARYRATQAKVDLAALIARVEDGLVESRPALFLALDEIQDPNNLGACLRSAAAAGVDGVIAPRRRSVGLTPAVRKVAVGGAERVPMVRVGNLAAALRELDAAGTQIVGLDRGSETYLFQLDLTGPIALVVGGESQGLRRLTQSLCHRCAAIPMVGAIESLNASVAVGIALYEVLRQRLQ